MKEFLEEDFKQVKDIIKDLNESVFNENKKGFINKDFIILFSFSLVLEILLKKILKEIENEKGGKDEGNN